MDGPQSVAVSPDGNHVYVASYEDNALTAFNRDPSTGTLSFAERIQDGDYGGIVDGLDGASSVAVSPDNAYVYVAGYNDNAVAVFEQDGSDLVYRDVVKDGGSIDGLYGAVSVVVSPDGDHVYVAGFNDDAVVIFSRDGGTLTYENVVEDGGSVDGLDGASSVVVSPGGEHVYVAGFNDDAVAIFSRDGDTLTYEDVIKDGGSVDGLDGASSVVVSPGGEHVYVAGFNDDAVVIFSRDGDTLAYKDVIKDGGSVDGLDSANSVVVSPGEGHHVYVASCNDDAVTAFSRDSTTGALTFLRMWRSTAGLDGAIGIGVGDEVSVPPETIPAGIYVASNDDDAVVSFGRNKATGVLGRGLAESESDGLDGARAVAMAGEYFYVASNIDDAVAIFSRDDTSGHAHYVGMVQDGVGGVDGLDGAQALTVSPDGKNVYVAGYNDDAVAIFSRSVITGGLSYRGVIKDGDSVVSGTVDGLDGAYAVVVSPDGRHVYVAGYVDDAVALFSRDLDTGDLTYKSVLKDTDPLAGLDGANSLALSPDGLCLYVASRNEDALAVFERLPSTGALFAHEVYRDGTGGVDGLDGARAVAVSPDGSQVYVASQVDDALAVFGRQEGCDLLYVGMHKDGVGGVDGLDAANGVAVSPDSGYVYVTGYGDNAVVVFARWRVYLPLVLKN